VKVPGPPGNFNQYKFKAACDIGARRSARAQESDMLDQQQQNFRALARRFAESELLPGAAQRDR